MLGKRAFHAFNIPLKTHYAILKYFSVHIGNGGDPREPSYQDGFEYWFYEDKITWEQEINMLIAEGNSGFCAMIANPAKVKVS